IMQVHWWTPHGQVRDNKPKLTIKDITEQQAGLYVCVSGLQGEHISVFDLHVYKKGSGSRPRREAATILNEQENTNAPRNDPVLRQRTESNFILAVCLSVIITFIVAFILGVLLRPLLDKLWMRIRSKRRSTTPQTTTSSTGPQPYVNEGYDVEDQEQEVRVGSRVRFSGITEVEDQVPYYVTVENDQADGSSESNTEVEGQYETVKKNASSITGGKRQSLERETHRGRADSSSSSSLQEGEVNASVINGKKLPTYSTENMAKSMEFEPIPDANDITELKRRGSSSASSLSSQEGNFSREPEQSVDPPAVTIPGNKNTMGRIPGFSTDPFPERPTRLTELNVDELDPELWNDSGESFSFNEGSERSSIRDLSSSALGRPLKDDDTWRQSKVESPSGKINIDSEAGDFNKPFGKKPLVDDVKQLKRSNTVSSSSSSENDESIGAPNKYVVNPEVTDESDTENYANSATLNRFGTLEDVTLNERMPGILIRQEAVTHGSVDDNMHIYDSPRKSDANISDKPGVCVDVGLDTVSKVKRYIEFKQFKPHSGPPTLPSFYSSSTKNNTLPDIIVLPSTPSFTTKDAIQETRRYSSSSDDGELTTEEDNFFRKVGVPSDGVSKVKRFITFKQFEPSSPSPPSFTKKDEMLKAKSYSSSSDDDDGHLTTKGDNVAVSSVGVSNVKRYSSSSDDDNDPLTTQGDNVDVSSVRVSKVKRFITFKQSEPSSPSPPSFTKKDEMLEAKSYSSSSDDDDDDHLTTKSDNVAVSSVGVSNVKRYSSSSDDDNDPLTTKGDNVDVSSVKVSKVKRFITFKQSEPSSPSPPSFTKKDEMLQAKSYSSSSDDDDDSLTTKGDNVAVSSVGVSNVKRYSSSSDDDNDSLTTQGDNVDVSSVRVSKVKRFITFKQSEPSSPSPPSFIKKDEMLEAKSYSSSSDDDDDPLTTKGDNVDVSSVGVSKVKRYSSSSDDDPLTTKGDNVDVSSVRVSKVKRFITFKQSEPSSPSPPSFTKKDEMLEAKSYSSSSDDDDDHLTTK
ncbi:hypothetical protein M9458_040187, partial [Cirrhinus mrigala]